MINRQALVYFQKNWRFVIHLLLKTRYFGVNNRWWSPYPSLLGWSFWQKLVAVLTIRPILANYQSLVMRSYSGWICKNKAHRLFD